MSRPRIGITTSLNDGVQNIAYDYIKAIEDAGGLPLIVPVLTSQAAANEFSALLDGLVITGGPGLTTGMIGSLPHDLKPVDPLRHQNDTFIYNTFIRDVRPVFGICYGMQFINAAAGGTIYGDLSDYIKTDIQHSTKRGGTEHQIMIDRDSLIGQLLGVDQLTVNTRHLQAIVDVGEGFRVAATSPDGVIEAIESADGRLIGVQFHPEAMTDKTAPLFEYLVERAKQQPIIR